MAEPGNTKHNELLEFAREQRGWSREYVAERIGAPESRTVYTWEREGVLPHPRYRQALCTLFERNLRDLGLVKKGEIPFWNVPYHRNPFFTGRDDMLTQLHRILVEEKTVAINQPYAITGLGGIGKTQLVIEYAYRYGYEYQSVLWMRAESRKVLISDFAATAAMLRLPESDAKDQQRAVEALKRWMGALTRWLLILDDVEDLRIISDFIPSRGKGHTLLTTRIQFTGTTALGIDMHVMEPEEGALFLLRRAKIIEQRTLFNQAPASDHTSAKELSQLMGGLPLALDQAGAYIEETECSIGEYLELYQNQGVALLNERGALASDHPKAVVSTLLLSFEKVHQASPLAGELLRFCTFLHPDAIPEEIIIKGAPELGRDLAAVVGNRALLNACIRELGKLSLLRRNAHTKFLTIHRLVQAVLKSMLDEETTRLWAKRVVLAVNQAFPEVQVATWSQCERLLPHAQVCIDLIIQYQSEFPEAARLLDLAGYYSYERGRYTEADQFLHHALKIREKAAGPKHPDTAICLNHLGLLYHAEGKYEEAELLYQRALEIREKMLGLEHPDTATILYNLAVLYHSQGKYEQAEALYQRALEIREKKLGTEHLDTVACLNDLAVLHADQGKFEQAEALEQRVLEIREKVLDTVHPDIAVSLSNLAGFYHIQGKYDLAEPLFARASAIFEKSLGPLHPNTATSFDNLAALYEDQGKYKEAEALSQRALTIKEKVLGPEHPAVSQSLTTLALLYQLQGIYERAEPLYQRALAIYETVLGPDHAYTAGSLAYLAALYRKQGKYEQAEPLAQRALSIKERVLGPEHAKTAASRANLAAIYLAQGKHEEAKALCKRALAIQEKLLEPEHLDIADSLMTLASIYIAKNKYQEAEPLLQRVLVIRQQALGFNHPEVASVLEVYAVLLRKMGREVEAARLESRASTLRIKQTQEVSPLSAAGEEKESTARLADTNPLKNFLTTCCEFHPGASSRAGDLWMAYQRWIQESGECFPVSTQKAFGQHLKSIGCTPYRTNKNRMWRGIALRNQHDGME
ncbi:MAG: FxSxx-COOH system tetratricopeptide repeat protein [Ktedonobacteraceae bacterium]